MHFGNTGPREPGLILESYSQGKRKDLERIAKSGPT